MDDDRRALLELAEEPGLWLPPEPKRTVFHGDGFAFVGYGRSAWVHRIRLKRSRVPETIGRIGAILAMKEIPEASWWVGRLTRPRDLAERLTEAGFEPDDPPRMTALTIAERPAGEPEVEVRRVGTPEEHQRALEIDWEAFGVPEEEREARRAELEQSWPVLAANDNHRTYLAYVDGEPVGFARAVFTPRAGILLGGATLPQARGRGVYTSLVHARWDEAVERGIPQLVVSAGPQSGPILRRLGFEPIGRVHVFKQRA
jgi:GNAT superfamily N-acetyltransferase